MASFTLVNNLESLVVDNPLTATATTLNVNPGDGVNFPSTFPYRLTIWDDGTYPDPSDDPAAEIVEVINRTVDALSITREQEGTAGVVHAASSRVAMLITAGMFNDSTHGITTKLDSIESGAEANNISDVNATALTDGGETGLHSHAGGSGTVDSVFGRTGIVVAVQDDYTHSQLDVVGANDHHDESHDIVSHADTNATGPELDSLTNGSNADSLHSHSGSGAGDMTMVVYDVNGNGIVDNSEAIQDGVSTKTYSEISTEIDNDISAHTANSDAHHNELHSILSHLGTTATGPELNELTAGGETALHSHSGGGVDSVFGRTGAVVTVQDDYNHSELASIGTDDHHNEIHTIVSHDTTVTGAQLDTDHTKLTGIDTGADVTADNSPQAHSATHVNGTDDIQDATPAQKGLATSAQITKLDSIESGAEANNISDTDAIDLTDGGETSLHTHTHTGGVSTDDVWDNKGDIAIATANNIASVLPVGSNGQILLADSAEVTGIKWGNLGGGGDMLKSVYDTADNGIVDLTLEQARTQGNVLTGPIIFNPPGDMTVININASNKDLTWMLGHTVDSYGFYWKYFGSGAGDANYLTVNSENGSGLDFWHMRYHQTTHIIDVDSDFNILNGHTIDGRVVSVDGVKLDTIETNAEANNISDTNAVALTDGGETELHSHAGGGTGDVSTDDIWDNKGDIAIATANNSASVLPVGLFNDFILKVDSAEAHGMKWAEPNPFIDGGNASSTYTMEQNINGGGA